ncbi:MAG: metalloregulator ArsR/SmtB family transcription factor [Bacilli bacterium]|nr:metalloregulator ArsR/SmtB family transcription factor [Bacilli bacterium]
MKKIKYEEVFNALSDSNRLKILLIINKGGEVCACKILEQLSITQPTLVYHMKTLLDAGLVTCYKRGTWCFYKIEKEMFLQIIDFLDDFKLIERVK